MGEGAFRAQKRVLGLTLESQAAVCVSVATKKQTWELSKPSQPQRYNVKLLQMKIVTWLVHQGQKNFRGAEKVSSLSAKGT